MTVNYKPKVYSVWQINSYIKGLLNDDALLSGFFAEAEISNFKEHSSGHLYFTLKDEKAAINAVMFRGFADELPFTPENGMKVIVFGRVSVYEKTGQYQLYAEMMEPSGTGGLYLAFLQLKTRLEAEGLFDSARKKPLPAWPGCIAVVTSPDGAAVRDVINVARRRNKLIDIVIAPVSVQGEYAAGEIAAAVKMINEWGRADVIIVARGGGSIEDLWAFNEEIVARAVYDLVIPVVSAVGHETDYTIIDFAADLRAPTPSAAAELCVPDLDAAVEKLKRLSEGLFNAVSGRLGDTKDELSNIVGRFPPISELLTPKHRELESVAKRLHREISHKLELSKSRIAGAIAALDSAAPINILKRGYAALYINGKIVSSAKEALPGQEMSARLSDGIVWGSVEKAEVFDGTEKN